MVSEHRIAIDVGCGTGQLTFSLARHFDHVVGIDPSAEQIQQANRVLENIARDVSNNDGLADENARKVRFIQSPGESIPCADNTADLVTAAQAAHWFDLPRFYSEVRRVARRSAILALISYGVPKLEDDLDATFSAFYWNELQAYWPPERKLVDQGYRTLDFPFTELTTPEMAITCTWDLPAFLGYLSTWSAIRNAHSQGNATILTRFTENIETLWGNPELKRLINWPLSLRVGQVDHQR